MKEILQKHLFTLLAMILLLVVIVLLAQKCGGNRPQGETLVIRDTVPGDPYPVEVPKYVPTVRLEQIPVEIPVEIRTPADTAAIIRDYFALRYYSDTLKNDTSLLVVVNDSIHANRIVSRQFTYQNRRPTAINTTIIQPPAKEPWLKLYAGVFAGYSAKHKTLAVGPELSLTLRPGALVRYGYDIAGNGHLVSLGWKVSLKPGGKNKPKLPAGFAAP